MNTLLKIASIITIVIATIKIGMMGNLSTNTCMVILGGSLMLLAGGKKAFKVIAAFLGLYLFIKVYGGGDLFRSAEFTQSILTLVVVSFGFYLILRAFFRRV